MQRGFFVHAFTGDRAHLEVRNDPWLSEPRAVGDVVRRYAGADGSDGLSSIRS